MCSNDRWCSGAYCRPGPLDADLASLRAAIDDLSATRTDTMNTGQRVAALAALSALNHRLAAIENDLIAGLARDATPAELGDGLAGTVARACAVKPAEAKNRIQDAEDTAARNAITGQPLTPRLPATADALSAGRLGRDHIREIHRFFNKLPAVVPADERAEHEQFLAELATTLRPDELRKAADKMLLLLGDEDAFTDIDRARRRGFTWSNQDADGMSKGVLYATPALRAEIDAVLAAWAAPGKCNPDDETPCLDGEPDEQTAQRDTRTPAQRRHDALSAVARAMLASGQLGVHNGLPVTVIVTATLQQLQEASGTAHTGGGTRLPMRDVIRMAAHAYHYLTIFDRATEAPLWLGRTRRTASAGQRIVLHAKDRGCSYPSCDMPGYLSEVHHAVCDWANDGLTNIDDLTFCCPQHHSLATNHGWTTRKNPFGHTEWVPPPGSTHPGGINNNHHPERYLQRRRDCGTPRQWGADHPPIDPPVPP